MKLREHLVTIERASTTEELERAAQAAWKGYSCVTRTGERITRAVHARGREIAAASPHAHLIPFLGNRRRLVLCGETYSVGYGQNGAGGRYVWHYAKEWMKRKLIAAGLADDAVDGVISWWASFPHRALASIEMGGWRTDFLYPGGRMGSLDTRKGGRQ